MEKDFLYQLDKKIIYREDINGLRAVAVLSVLIFHFFPDSLNIFKGFLGVDIFFVISGFLITKMLYRDMYLENFKFRNFYLRRAKRIIPNALFYIFITLLLSLTFLTAEDYINFIDSLMAAILFVPNIYFWIDGGYFGANDSLKPLLHYWSLGVEEQYYLIYPLALYIVWNFFQKKFLLLLVAISIFSFILNVYLISIGGQNPAFFLLPSRIWEFGLGAISALLKIKSCNSKWLSNIIFFLIIISLFLPKFSYIPDALPVAVFTAIFLVLNNQNNSISSILLSNKLIKYIGKISFSVYLSHWPVSVFLTYVLIEYNIYYVFIGLLTIFLISTLSYFFIEKPFLRSGRFSFSIYVLIALIAIIGLAKYGLYTVEHENKELFLENKIASQIANNYRCEISSYQHFGASRACHLKGSKDINNTNIILLGNSHAQMYAPLIIKNESIKNAFLVPLNNCLPTINININSQCLKKARKNLEAIKSLKNPKKVIIGMTWEHKALDLDGIKFTKEDLLNDIDVLIKAIESSGKEVAVISPIPTPKFDFPSIMSRKIRFHGLSKDDFLNDSRVNFRDFYDGIKIYDDFFNHEYPEKYINIYKSLCDQSYCYFADDGGSFYSDGSHLGAYGLSKIIEFKIN